MYEGVYNYNPNKHFQFIEQVVAEQMLLDANNAFFDTYEVECAKWYASWACHSANKAPDTVNTWTHDSYNNLSATNNAEDASMVLERLKNESFPKLDDNDQSRPHTKASKKGGGGAGPAGRKEKRRQKDTATEDDAAHDMPGSSNPKKRKRACGGARKKLTLEKQAKAARESADAEVSPAPVDAVDPDEIPAPVVNAANPAQPSAAYKQKRADLQAGRAASRTKQVDAAGQHAVNPRSAVLPSAGGAGGGGGAEREVVVVDLTGDSDGENQLVPAAKQGGSVSHVKKNKTKKSCNALTCRRILCH